MLALQLLALSFLAFAAHAQTAPIDAFNLAQAGLVGSDGIIADKGNISKLNFTWSVGVRPAFVDDGSPVAVLPGITLTRNQTESQPAIFLASDNAILGKAYLVAMVDPDAPSPENRTLAQVRHWIVPDTVPQAVTDKPGLYVLRATTEPVATYLGPGPDVGLHRYTILIFEQPTLKVEAPRGDDVAPLLGFDIATYASRINGLKLVGGTYFLVGPYGTEANNGTYTPAQPDSSGGSSSTTELPTGTPVSQSQIPGQHTGVPSDGIVSAFGVGGGIDVGVLAVIIAMLFA